MHKEKDPGQYNCYQNLATPAEKNSLHVAFLRSEAKTTTHILTHKDRKPHILSVAKFRIAYTTHTIPAISLYISSPLLYRVALNYGSYAKCSMDSCRLKTAFSKMSKSSVI